MAWTSTPCSHLASSIGMRHGPDHPSTFLVVPDMDRPDGCVTTDAEGRFEPALGHGPRQGGRVADQPPGLEKAYIAVLDRVPRGTGRPPWQSSTTFNSLYGNTGLRVPTGQLSTMFWVPNKSITGLVRDKATGQPVAGVTVAGQVPGRMWAVVMTKTDGQGHFRIDGLPKASSYKVDIRPEPGSPYLPSHHRPSPTPKASSRLI